MVKKKTVAVVDGGKPIPEIAGGLAKEVVASMCKNGKLTAYGRRMAKLMDKAMPDENVDEWGWMLSRKERAEIKRRAAEKRAEHEKQLAARRERDRARRQAKRTAEVLAMPADEVPTEEKGKYNTFFEVVEGYRKAIAEFKRGGCDWDRLDQLARKVKDKTSAWIRRMHPEYVQYFYYQYCEWCRDAMVDQAQSAEQNARLQLVWKKLLTPRVHPPWERPFGSPMPRWPRR